MDDEQTQNKLERDQQYRIKNKYSWMNPKGANAKIEDDQDENTSSNNESSEMEADFR